jgi:hypothetical protein
VVKVVISQVVKVVISQVVKVVISQVVKVVISQRVHFIIPRINVVHIDLAGFGNPFIWLDLVTHLLGGIW